MPTNQEIFEALRSLDGIMEEGLQESMNLPGYTYRDLPRMTRECMSDFVSLVGEENLRWVTLADYGPSVRGQVMISPEGMQKISEFNKSEKENING